MNAIAALFALLTVSPAFGQDDPEEDIFLDEDTDLFGEDDDDLEIELDDDRLEEGDDLEDLGAEEGDDDLESFSDDEEDEFNLLGDEDDTEMPTGPGVDSADAYRQAQERAAALPLDEAIQMWEAYLVQYPQSLFRTRINEDIQKLMDDLYSSRIAGSGPAVDAMAEEVLLSQGLHLDNMNPRSRFQTAFEWGAPAWMNLIVDYEHAFSRNFSVHGAIGREYAGWSATPGVKWALVKSTRTQTVLTLMTDAHLNLNPAFPGLRPQLAFGKRFGDTLDLIVMGGGELEFRDPLGVVATGGAHITVHASDTVGVFFETNTHFKNFNWEGDVFTFDVLSFGMKFYPQKASVESTSRKDMEVNLGATIPYWAQYWQYHYGSFMGQFNYYVPN